MNLCNEKVNVAKIIKEMITGKNYEIKQST